MKKGHVNFVEKNLILNIIVNIIVADSVFGKMRIEGKVEIELKRIVNFVEKNLILAILVKSIVIALVLGDGGKEKRAIMKIKKVFTPIIPVNFVERKQCWISIL